MALAREFARVPASVVVFGFESLVCLIGARLCSERQLPHGLVTMPVAVLHSEQSEFGAHLLAQFVPGLVSCPVQYRTDHLPPPLRSSCKTHHFDARAQGPELVHRDSFLVSIRVRLFRARDLQPWTRDPVDEGLHRGARLFTFLCNAHRPKSPSFLARLSNCADHSASESLSESAPLNLGALADRCAGATPMVDALVPLISDSSFENAATCLAAGI